jgi:ABC-type amino acid transport system permease subunit
MVRISSSLARDRGTGAPPASLLNPEAIPLSTITRGVNSHDIISIGRANTRDNRSACWMAMVLGVASENTRRRVVRPRVAIRILIPGWSGKYLIARAVARAAAAVFTRLLPSRMVDKSLAGR